MGQYISRWYNTDNGLSQNSIKDIIQDRYGFIWLSTENGIIRYDGQSFINHNEMKVKNLHFHNFHGNIAADRIFCQNDYMQDQVLINRRSIKLSTTAHSLQKQDVNNDSDLIQIFKIHMSENFHNNITYYVKLSSGKYSFFNKKIEYSDGKKTITIPISVNDMHSLFADHETLYITDKIQRKTYSICDGQISEVENATVINDPTTKIYWHQATNQTFIIHKDRIYLLNISDGKLHLKYLVTYDSIQKNDITSIYYDKNYNRLYLGSPVSGLNIVEPSQFQSMKTGADLQTNIGYASLPLTSNTIIDSWGNVFNNEGIIKKYNFQDNDGYMMLFDSFHNILIGSTNFITRYTKSSGYTRSSTITFSSKITGICSEPGLHAVATMDKQGALIHFFENDQFGPVLYTWRFAGIVNSILKYGTDKILIGASTGLYIIDTDGRNKKKLLDAISIKSIMRTSDGEVWVTTRKDGFYIIKDGRAIKAPLDHDLYLSTAHFIQYDAYGNYWISSDNGLFKISKHQLLRSIQQKEPTTYYRFTKSMGLPSSEFNGGVLPSAYTLKNGELVFPSMKGFVFISPKNIKSYYPDKSAIFIERAKIDNGPVTPFNQRLVAERGSDYIEIFIDIPYYADVANILMHVKAEGTPYQDGQQIDLKEEKKIKLSGLEPGVYNINIRTLISEEGKYEYRNIVLEIKPQFYQTVAFKTSIIMVVILSLGGFVQTRSKFLNKRNKALKRTVSSMSSELKEASKNLHLMKNDMQQQTEYQKKLIETISHDISTPVKFIAMLSQKLHHTDNIEFQKKYFDSIHRASEELYKFTLNLKEYNDLYKTDVIYTDESYAINEILTEKKKLFDEIALDNKNSISIKANNEISCTINRNILACIIHNLIDNSVKYTENGIITIGMKKTMTETLITIEDTGCGMSAEQIEYYNDLFLKTEQMAFKNYGLGLHMVIHLIKKINGRISFCKALSNGTIVTIALKNNL